MNVEQTVREYIEPLLHMSLATVSGDTPWVCEVHFAYDEVLNLYFRSKPSRRHSQEIAKNPKVAGNIVRQHGPGERPVGVYFEGVAKLLEPGPEQTKAYDAIMQRINPPGDILADSQNADGHKFYKISVNNFYVFGVFEGPGAKQYKLEWNGGRK